MQSGNLFRLLQVLCQADVAFVVVGGLAAVLNGAPIGTFDMAIVFSREPENVDHLLKVLVEVDAIFRIQPHRRLRPQQGHLDGGSHLNLLTRYGPLDLLGTVGRGLTYSDLLSRSVEMEVDEGLRVRVLDLETVIATKEYAGADKDRAVLPILRQTLRLAKDKNG